LRTILIVGACAPLAADEPPSLAALRLGGLSSALAAQPGWSVELALPAALAGAGGLVCEQGQVDEVARATRAELVILTSLEQLQGCVPRPSYRLWVDLALADRLGAPAQELLAGVERFIVGDAAQRTMMQTALERAGVESAERILLVPLAVPAIAPLDRERSDEPLCVVWSEPEPRRQELVRQLLVGCDRLAAGELALIGVSWHGEDHPRLSRRSVLGWKDHQTLLAHAWLSLRLERPTCRLGRCCRHCMISGAGSRSWWGRITRSHNGWRHQVQDLSSMATTAMRWRIWSQSCMPSPSSSNGLQLPRVH
jgi:hypothetical protein